MSEDKSLSLSPDMGTLNSTLQNIVLDYTNLLEQIEESEGELTPEQEVLLEQISKDFDKKGEGYAHVIRAIELDIFKIDEEIDRLQKRKVTFENKIKRFNFILTPIIKKFGVKRVTPTGIVKHLLQFPLHSFEVVESEKTEITNVENMPKSLLRYKVEIDNYNLELLNTIKINYNIKGRDCLKTSVLAYIDTLEKRKSELEHLLDVDSTNQLSLFQQSESNEKLEIELGNIIEELNKINEGIKTTINTKLNLK